jgi:hypothetical protein
MIRTAQWIKNKIKKFQKKVLTNFNLCAIIKTQRGAFQESPREDKEPKRGQGRTNPPKKNKKMLDKSRKL